MNQKHQNFNALSIKGIDLLKVILSILDKEKAALTERDLEQIEKLTTKKALILDEFSANIKKRMDLFQSENNQISEENISSFLNECKDASLKTVCIDNWSNLQHILKEVITANKVNEQIANKNHTNIKTILSILQGHKPNNMLYNAKGSKGDYSGQSRIGKA